MAARFKSVIVFLVAVIVVATTACDGALPEPTPNIEATVDVRVEQERATNCTAVHSPNSGYTQNPGTGCIGP